MPEWTPDAGVDISKTPFGRTILELYHLQERKGRDYGTADDHLANIRASERFGIQPWVAAVLRANDKMTRMASFINRGNLDNESIEDSLLDAAVYFIHAYNLYTGRE